MVELLPVAAWLDERHLGPLGLSNYWGYNPVAWFVPDPRLAPGGMAEVRAAVAALHEAGIAVILDVVYNHSGESDHLGPTLSMRGLDNAGYYRLLPNDKRLYVNDAGCGNVLALERPQGVRLAMDAMRHWVTEAGVDGFRFDLATTLARRDSGFDPAAPILAAIGQDPLLSSLVLIAEPRRLSARLGRVERPLPRYAAPLHEGRGRPRRRTRDPHRRLGRHLRVAAPVIGREHQLRHRA